MTMLPDEDDVAATVADAHDDDFVAATGFLSIDDFDDDDHVAGHRRRPSDLRRHQHTRYSARTHTHTHTHTHMRAPVVVATRSAGRRLDPRPVTCRLQVAPPGTHANAAATRRTSPPVGLLADGPRRCLVGGSTDFARTYRSAAAPVGPRHEEHRPRSC